MNPSGFQSIKNSVFMKKEETIGYTQGLNFIVGTALVHLQQNEENTFWFMISLLCDHKFMQVFNF